MNNDYFKVMLELIKISNELQKNISGFCKKSFISINTSQSLILYLLEESGGKMSHLELKERIAGLYTNINYTIQMLDDRGYIIRKSGTEEGLDKRCTYIYLTEKGKEVYRKISEYSFSKKGELEKERWYKLALAIK